MTRAAWIRKNGCNSILGLLVTGACGSVAYDVTRTPGWDDSLSLYKLLSGEAGRPRAGGCGVEAGLGGRVLEAGPFYPEGVGGLGAATFPVCPVPPRPASPSLPSRFPELCSLIFP